jgi:hypothetical protein
MGLVRMHELNLVLAETRRYRKSLPFLLQQASFISWKPGQREVQGPVMTVTAVLILSQRKAIVRCWTGLARPKTGWVMFTGCHGPIREPD